MIDLRCPSGSLYGKIEQDLLEVKCKNSRCGARVGVVVLHKFDVLTGTLIETKMYRDPSREVRSNDARNVAAVRSS